MKNKKLLYSLFLLPTLMLTACGYGLEEIVKSDVYDSTVFVNNYYTKWDKRIDTEHKDNQIDETSLDSAETQDITPEVENLDHPIEEPISQVVEETQPTENLLDDDFLKNVEEI